VNRFAELSAPWLHTIELGSSSLADRVVSPESNAVGACVRVVRGEKMRNESQLFDEFAAAWQFPYYFGENWAAFSECLADLSWAPANRYLTVVRDAECILSEEPRSLLTLMKVLNDLGREWATKADTTRPWAPEPRPFHVLLHCDIGRGDLLQRILAPSNAQLDAISLP
jgi:hypothetical protein